MKIKYFFLLVVSLSLGMIANAQRFEGGIKAGASFSQIDGDGHGGYHKLGFTGGAFAGYPIGKKMLVEGELLFTQKGSYATSGADGSGDEFAINESCIDIPLFISYNFVNKVWGQIGIMPSLIIDAEELANNIVNLGSPDFKSIDFSILLGLNYKFHKNFSVDFRYTYSLLNIRDGVQNGYTGNNVLGYGQYNNVCSITASYWF